MESLYCNFALNRSKNVCATTDTVFFPLVEVSTSVVTLSRIWPGMRPTPFFWKNPPQTTSCVTSDAKHSTAQVLCFLRRVEWISTVEQCIVLGILCHTGGSLRRVLPEIGWLHPHGKKWSFALRGGISPRQKAGGSVPNRSVGDQSWVEV